MGMINRVYVSLSMGLTSIVPMQKGGLAKCCKVPWPDESYSGMSEYQSDFF